jgi:UDP-N-acetylmuramate--L-alanine ligase/UDP-N-acetylenolpyruvoylglucosamine reductase
MAKKNIHFVGIGGIGMSGIAAVLLETGYSVSGSDLEASDVTRRIESLGGRVFCGHSPANLPRDTDVLVYSSSVTRQNPEYKEALHRGIKIVHRAEMLAEIFNKKVGIAVTGTHGKTTTTSLLAVMLERAGLDPTAVIGGEIKEFGGNARLGKSEYIVIEADESDSSFLYFKPHYAVLTNLEMEHVDHYKTMEDAKAAYRGFMNNVRPHGAVFLNCGDKNLASIAKGYRGKIVTFGFSECADIHPVDIRMDGFKTSFGCVRNGEYFGRIRLRIPGRHNVLNTLAAIGVGACLGIKPADIIGAAGDFAGAKRRFQLRSAPGDVMLIDDYAHHPTEIKAVLDTCRNFRGRDVTVVFQPHRYTRTKFLADEFGRCFDGINRLILTQVYAASEKPIKGVSVENIHASVRKSGLGDVRVMKKEEISDYLMKSRKPKDMILILGAGDIKNVADEMAKRIFAENLRKAMNGKIILGQNLSLRTSFKIGGPADIWIEPKDESDLAKALRLSKESGIPAFIIGNGSNILVRDEGFRGMMVRLGSKGFRGLSIKGDIVRVGGGFSLVGLVKACCDSALSGLESLIGIPGTVGGAIYMNAGGSANPMFKNIGDVVESLKVMDRDGKVSTMGARDVKFGYRRSNIDSRIVLEAVLRLERSDRRHLVASCAQFLKIKMEKQALDMPSAGCIFKNPPFAQFSCGQMIDMLGLKGRSCGGATISEKHANFIVNRGGAKYTDVIFLIDMIKKKIRESYGIDLELEVQIL